MSVNNDIRTNCATNTLFTANAIYIEITNQCNLNCRSCYNRSGLNNERIQLSVTELEEIIGLFLPHGLKRVLLSGGEPTLHTEFGAVLDLIDRYPDLSFGMVTNGTVHNPKLIAFINTRPNLTLQISLDGSCEEKNALTRGPGHFEKVLSLARQLHPIGSRPLLKMVLSQRNFSDLDAFCDLAFSMGFVPEFAFLNCSGNGAESWETQNLTPQQKLYVLRRIEQINKEQETDVFLPLCTSTCPYTGEHPKLSPCIKADGSIQPCQSLYDSSFCLGNALSFDEEAFNRKLHELFTLARKRMSQDYGCSKCLLSSSCGRGCMAKAFNQHQDPLADDDSCQFRKLQFLYHDLHQNKGAIR